MEVRCWGGGTCGRGKGWRTRGNRRPTHRGGDRLGSSGGGWSTGGGRKGGADRVGCEIRAGLEASWATQWKMKNGNVEATRELRAELSWAGH
jgi:hypothetical protein